jgi:hypothetical protein
LPLCFRFGYLCAPNRDVETNESFLYGLFANALLLANWIFAGRTSTASAQLSVRNPHPWQFIFTTSLRDEAF